MRTALADWYRRTLSESGTWAEVGFCRGSDGRLSADLVAINEADRRLLFGQVCLSEGQYQKAALTAAAGSWLQHHPEYAGFTSGVTGLFPETMQRDF